MDVIPSEALPSPEGPSEAIYLKAYHELWLSLTHREIASTLVKAPGSRKVPDFMGNDIPFSQQM